MSIALHIDTTGGSNFEGYHLRNVGSLHVGGSALASAEFEVTGDAVISGNLTVGSLSFTGLVSADTFQATGQDTPLSGSGVEISFSLGVGNVIAYNRTGTAFLPLSVSGLTLTLGSTGSGVNDLIRFDQNGGERGRMLGGIFYWGTTVSGGSPSAGEIVLANTKSLRSVNSGTSASVPLIRLDANNRAVLGDITNAIYPSLPYFATGSIPAAAASLNGCIMFDSSTTRFIYYIAGGRYYLPGTSF